MNKIQIQLFIIIIGLLLCVAGYKGVEKYFTYNYKKSVNVLLAYNNYETKDYVGYVIENETTTTLTTTTQNIITTTKIPDLIEQSTLNTPTFTDDGSIIYEGLTLTELVDKLNRNLNSTLTNTGYYFAEYFMRTGLDPYLSVSIALHETGCKWTCSSLVRNNYNIGGLKSGGQFMKFSTLKEGIDGYLDILYNNYYLNGLNTAELIQPKYAPSSETWVSKINYYINSIREN